MELEQLIVNARELQEAIYQDNSRMLEIGKLALGITPATPDHPFASRIRLTDIDDREEFRRRVGEIRVMTGGLRSSIVGNEGNLDRIAVEVSQVLESKGLAERLRAECEELHGILELASDALPDQFQEELAQLPNVRSWRARETELEFTLALYQRGKEVLSKGEIIFPTTSAPETPTEEGTSKPSPSADLIQVIDKEVGRYLVGGREVKISTPPASEIFFRCLEDLQSSDQGVAKAELDSIAVEHGYRLNKHTLFDNRVIINHALDGAFAGKPPVYLEVKRSETEVINKIPRKWAFYGFVANEQSERLAPPPPSDLKDQVDISLPEGVGEKS